LEEYKEKVKPLQTDKNESLVLLYTTDKESQHAYIQNAERQSYDVLLMDTLIDAHFINFMESKLEKTEFKRVDADTLDNLISKDDIKESVLTAEQQEKLKKLFETQIDNTMAKIELRSLSPDDAPITITRDEFMRRMKDMQALGGNQFMGNFPDSFNVVLNSNHPLLDKLLKKKQENKEVMAKQLYDLALLSQNMLKGEALTNFVNRSFQLASE
jgi:molecular chaperone HtpG